MAKQRFWEEFEGMSAKRLNSYKGRLDYAQIADGINAARRNALRLLEDAQILLRAERYATAASLAILSIEESGKQHILRGLALATADEELLGLWRDYRSHTKKNIPKLAFAYKKIHPHWSWATAMRIA